MTSASRVVKVNRTMLTRLGFEPSCIACGRTLQIGEKAISKVTRNRTNGSRSYICEACSKKPVLIYPISWAKGGGQRS